MHVQARTGLDMAETNARKTGNDVQGDHLFQGVLQQIFLVRIHACLKTSRKLFSCSQKQASRNAMFKRQNVSRKKNWTIRAFAGLKVQRTRSLIGFDGQLLNLL